MGKNLAIVFAYFILLLVSVPFYWGERGLPGGDRILFFGLPTWFCVSVIGSTCVSVLTAALILMRWPASDSSQEGESGS